MKIYIVFRNSDMTEGRGPMELNAIFTNKQKAIDYADSKCGVMGCGGNWSKVPQYISSDEYTVGGWSTVNGRKAIGKYLVHSWQWDVVEFEVEDEREEK